MGSLMSCFKKPASSRKSSRNSSRNSSQPATNSCENSINSSHNSVKSCDLEPANSIENPCNPPYNLFANSNSETDTNPCENPCNPESNTFESCYLDDYLKIHQFDLTSSQDASSRNQKIRNILKNLYVLLGHGQHARDIKEAVSKLMQRNYQEILAWDGKSKLVVFVPEFYLNKATEYVSPEDGPRLLRDCEDLTRAETNPERRKHLKSHENKFLAGKRTWMGEYPEMNLYNALTEYAEKKNESLAVFHGLNLFKFDPDRHPGKYT